MPDMNGQELLTAIRQRNLDVDFLVMTGFGTTETAVEFMRDGAVDYISKPFDIKQMLLRVHAVLDRRVPIIFFNNWSATRITKSHLKLSF